MVEQGVFNQPIAVYATDQELQGTKPGKFQVSITHCDELGAAVAFPETHPMGIDIERIAQGRGKVLESQMTVSEIQQVKLLPLNYDYLLTQVWTVKEALSKALKTGLTLPIEFYEITEFQVQGNHIICYFKNFTQYKAISFGFGPFVCSLVYPRNTEIRFNCEVLSGKLLPLA